MSNHAIEISVKKATETNLQELTTDGLVLCLSKKQLEQQSWIEEKIDASIRQLSDKKLFSGGAKDVQVIPTLGLIQASHVILLGIGETPTLQSVREAAALLSQTAIKNKLDTLEILLPEANLIEGSNGDKTSNLIESSSVARAFTEGLLLGRYKAKTYERDAKERPLFKQATYIIADDVKDVAAVEAQVELARVFAEATDFARDLSNMPGNYLYPAKLAEFAREIGEEAGFEVEILDEHAIEAKGMGGLYSVGKGSVNPPRMIVLKYQGRDEWTDVLGLVGKGITFDTGGISLKKADGMEEMISDMSGAATVLGVMKAIGKLRPKVNVLAVIPTAENMPSGRAYKPGDVVTTLSGRTIEVINTDAEGRVILCDGITYAKQLGANKLIDLATLTGAMLIALGDVATGAVTNNEDFMGSLMEVSKETGERIWQLPVYPEYWEMLKTPVADVKNSAGRFAGSITAGLFLGTFAEDTPWIHLDIAGTSWLHSPRGVDPKFGTGALVRTLTEYIHRSETN